LLHESGSWGWLTDDQWRVVFMTDELRRAAGGHGQLAPMPLGVVWGSREFLEAQRGHLGGSYTADQLREQVSIVAPLMLADLPHGLDRLRELLDPSVHDLIDGLEPDHSDMVLRSTTAPGVGGPVAVWYMGTRLRDATGRTVGWMWQSKPGVGMTTISAMTSMGDTRHFERMMRASRPSRQPAAILMADLEGSSQLARRLPTASYFALGRRLVRAADQCVIDAGGLVGRHVGDGVVAFFLAEESGSESAAAAACIAAARSLHSTVPEVAARSGLATDDVIVRFGLHWGSTLYVGNMTSAGRSEVTALGDEVNEAARIEACATGGLMLASKDLVERLGPTDAASLDIDPGGLVYTTLAEIPTATEKARRDAPAIPVCAVQLD
jgi:class 3 adenylate cyclase